MSHPDDRTLEQYVLGAPGTAQRRAELEAHLGECAGCRALHAEITAYYDEARAVAAESERRAATALILRATGARMPEWSPADVPATRLSRRARLLVYMVRHPILSGTSLLGGIVLLAFGLSFLRLSAAPAPAFARAEKGSLVILDREGRELWRRYFGPELTEERLTDVTNSPVAVRDLDGDGRAEVVVALGSFPAWQRRNEVVCLGPDGKERWSYTLHRQMVFGSESFADAYTANFLCVEDFDQDGRVEVIALFNVMMYYPCLLLTLDGATGTPVAEYWHSGGLTRCVPFDADRDGKLELVAIGENNGFNRAVLMVLDPLRMSGHSPAPPAYTPRGIPESGQHTYVLLPASDVNRLADHRPAVHEIMREGTGSLVVTTWEVKSNEPYLLLFHFDDRFRCTKVVGTDEYMAHHRRQVERGTLNRVPDEAYFEGLRRGVQYWTGEKFVGWEEWTAGTTAQ